jgi:hypothetical protein
MDSDNGSIEYGLHTPMPGGSSYDVTWDDEVITIYIPPVGYTIDRFPDPVTGKESRELVPCEILNIDLKIEDQKWKREGLPKEWKRWRKEERQKQRTDPDFINPEAEKIRQKHWTRRINGVWLAIGNRKGEPTQYFYLPGPFWHFLNWWRQDFGYPDFRVAQWEIYLVLCLTYDHPDMFGLAFAGNRRGGKSAISMHHLWEYPSRTKFAKAGMQAQTEKDAKKKWDESLVIGFLSQPDFFKPKYDKSNQLKREILYRPRLKGNRASDKDEDDDDEVIDGALNSRIDFRETKSGSYDGYKMHRNSFEEPGKWEEEDVQTTLAVIIPSLKDIDGTKLGCTFLPTTIEDMEAGGREFIKLAENSRPSLMKKNDSGKTSSQIIFLYQAAYKNYITDEYGRAIIDDPLPNEKVYDNRGKRILKGSRTVLLNERKAVQHDRQQYVQLVRKYSFTWAEAKMMDTAQSPFNVQILEARMNELNSGRAFPFVKGNFDWVDKIDGEVDFVRDDVAGRWALHLNPDKYGDYFDGDNRITNRNTFEMFEGKKLWAPRNNRFFRIGTDPIRYNKTDDPRASKAGAYVWYKFDPNKDLGKPESQWVSHNFIAQYLIRPSEFSIFGEDMIKACRFFGCSILPEPNVNNLQQHFDNRGYGKYILFRKDFSEEVIPKTRTQNDDFKGLDASETIVDAWVSRLITLVNRHGKRFLFPELCEQMINFIIKDRTKYDAVVAAGYAVLAAEANIDDIPDDNENEGESLMTMYDADGSVSQPIADTEQQEYENDFFRI